MEKLLNNINTSKAQGPDNISNTVLKNCASQLSPALATIFQCSIDSGKLPSDWLNANVSPVFKKGDSHLAENYRPVSLTCVSCKLLEHIVCKHLLDHLERHNILTSVNHGFRSGFSCETQLLTTMHDLLQQYDIGSQIDMVILDFSKAFDTVPHARLLHKLTCYGVVGSLHKWLGDFLTNRNMQVVVDGESSDSVYVESGVPQGTVLGPILFLCHINDLPDSVKSTVRLFADDCLLYRPISNQRDHMQLQEDLRSLESWAATWGMRFNAKKCYVMSMNCKSSRFYQLDNHILQQVKENPYLGVLLSDNLQFDTHISNICKKAASTLGFLKRNLKHSPLQCRKTAYLALVRSTLEYSSIVWDPFRQHNIDRIEKVQRQAARFITGNYTSREPDCVSHMLQSLELPPLGDRRKQNRFVLFFKVVGGLVPAMPPDEFVTPVINKRRIKPKRFDDFQTSSLHVVKQHSLCNSLGYKNIQCSTESFRHSYFPKTISD